MTAKPLASIECSDRGCFIIFGLLALNFMFVKFIYTTIDKIVTLLSRAFLKTPSASAIIVESYNNLLLLNLLLTYFQLDHFCCMIARSTGYGHWDRGGLVYMRGAVGVCGLCVMT